VTLIVTNVQQVNNDFFY